MSTFQVSGWNQKVANFTDYSIPLFFSEYGCNQARPRPFNEIETLFGPQMTPVFSGGLVYEYSQESNDYGLVEVSGNSSEIKYLDDFKNLKAAYEKTPLPTGDGGYKPVGKPSECPKEAPGWEGKETLPTMPDAASKYLANGAGAPRGTDGPSNQYIPGEGTKPSDTGSAGAVPKPTGATDKGNDTQEDSGNSGILNAGTGAAWASGAMVVLAVIGGALL